MYFPQWLSSSRKIVESRETAATHLCHITSLAVFCFFFFNFPVDDGKDCGGRRRLKFQQAIEFWHFGVPGALHCHAGSSSLFLDPGAAEGGTGTAPSLPGGGGGHEVAWQ